MKIEITDYQFSDAVKQMNLRQLKSLKFVVERTLRMKSDEYYQSSEKERIFSQLKANQISRVKAMKKLNQVTDCGLVEAKKQIENFLSDGQDVGGKSFYGC